MTETLTVQRNLELLGRYRYMEIQMMELMGGWAHTMVDPEIKIGFGRQMYQDAVHADLLGKRIPELKGRSAHFHVIPPSDAVVRVIERIWNAEGDLRRMSGLYRVLKPALTEAYRTHIALAELPADEPTAYILRHIADEERDQCAWAEKIIARLPEDDALAALEEELTAALAEGGGFVAQGSPRGTYAFTKAQPYSRQPVRDGRWDILPGSAEFTEKNWSFDSNEGKQHLLHDLLNSEFITVERMGRILADFPGIPWEMKLDMARQAWDEARHAEIVQRRLEELGGRVGMFRTSCWGWEQDVNRPDPLERLALSNMTFESESCKHLRDWIRKAKEGGDERSTQLLEFLLADEVNHVLYGVHWIDELTRDDPARRARVMAYPVSVLEGQHPVGVRFNETINAR
ncbi:MAG TPA: DUF455 family protein [Bacteroidota bacterium]|nr:DUF455 family protein [Bacteroidota bacterium]